MRHNKSFNHLSRKKAHRDALLANMTISLIKHKRIFTTLAKAKALRMYAEPLINRAKEDSMANRRLVFSYLQNKEAVTELFREISQKIADRPGGYTRILKTGNRLGSLTTTKTCSRTRRKPRKPAAPAVPARPLPKPRRPQQLPRLLPQNPLNNSERVAPETD